MKFDFISACVYNNLINVFFNQWESKYKINQFSRQKTLGGNKIFFQKFFGQLFLYGRYFVFVFTLCILSYYLFIILGLVWVFNKWFLFDCCNKRILFSAQTHNPTAHCQKLQEFKEISFLYAKMYSLNL